MRLAEVKTLCSEEDEEQLSALSRYHDRLGKPIDQESEEEDFKEELELMEGRRRRHTGVGPSYEKWRPNKSDGRYLGKIVLCIFYLCLKTC